MTNGMFGTKTDGTLWSWGHNQWGNLGQNNTTNYSSPIQVPGDWDVSKIRLSWDEGAAAISAVSS
jgi:alpha-tubulin suppressor-like RCC1 family protein